MVKVFKIVLNQSHCIGGQNCYLPGSAVSGYLEVENDEPKNYKAIIVYLRGYGHVSWSEGSGENRRNYSATEDYVNLQIVVWSSSQSEGTHPSGRYHYHFQFTLPQNCPPSFEHDQTGRISYVIEAAIHTGSLNFNQKYQIYFNMLKLVSVDTTIPQSPVRLEIRKKVGWLCCNSGMITGTVQVASTVLNVGDQIPMQVYVENGSGRQVSIKCLLVERVYYFAEGHHHMRLNSILEYQCEHLQPHSTSSDISFNFLVPNVRPAITHSNVIKTDHIVQVVLVIPLAINKIVEIPVVIGNAAILQQHPS